MPCAVVCCIMATIKESLVYPFNRDDWYRTIVVGGALAFLSFLILPIFLVAGYIYRVVQSRLAGEPSPPTFDRWTDLFVDGLKVWAIGVVYLFVPAVIASVMIGGAVIAVLTGTELGLVFGTLGIISGLILATVLGLLLSYVAVAGVVEFARTEQFWSAFDMTALRPILLNSTYASAWVRGLAVIIVAGVLGSMLSVIPVLGTLAAAGLGFYAQMAAASLWADGVSATALQANRKRQLPMDDTAA